MSSRRRKKQLAFVRAGPVARFWFIFWHALWEGNSEVKLFEENADILDPDMPEAVANIPMPRKDVERLMKERGLDKWVHKKLLDVLYTTLEARSESNVQSEMHARNGGLVEMKQTKSQAAV